VITPNRIYRRRVHQHSTVLSIEQEAIIKAKLRDTMDRFKKQITLLWVPGHMGIPGNKQADEEAKAALDDNIQQNEEHPPKDLEKWLKTGTTKIKKERWRNESTT
jgi:ribonuclease HI